jgi:hypothetical protein
MSAIYRFFEWCEKSPLHDMIANHETGYPALETFHLFGLTLLLGTLVILCLRLFGVMLKQQPVAELAGELSPYQTAGLCLMLITGPLMVVATAERCYGNTSFWIKMALLVIALIFHFAYFRKLVRRDDANIAPGMAKLAAAVTLVLWFGVGMAGRSIGFFG